MATAKKRPEEDMLVGSSEVEVDDLSGQIVLLGRLHQVPTPVNELLQEVVSGMARRGAAAGSVDPGWLLNRAVQASGGPAIGARSAR